MFDLSAPWWEFSLRALIVYIALMVMVRLGGKRTVGQFTPFDLLVVMLLSESVSSSLSGGDNSVGGGLISAVTLVLLNVAVAVCTARSTRFEKLAEGSPVLVGRDGEIFRDVLKRNHVSVGELEKSMREADCELSDLKCAFLETDGSFSIMTKN